MYVSKKPSCRCVRFALSAIAVIMLCGTLAAQNIRITGKVTDRANLPLIGVSVMVDGTRTGVATDLQGSYAINAPGNATLVFSAIGMEAQRIPVNNRSLINIIMLDDAVLLDELVVVGYGTQTRANLTGAVATVDTKLLEARPIADVGRGLQGSTPGLNIQIPSGEIGSDPIIRIRGQFGSMQGGSSPLILMDNVEIPSIQMLNPDDIESISILKDAASASIYGAKAAFGVVLITTKKGARTESVNVSYSGNVSFQNISKKMEMGQLDALEYTLHAMERVNATVAGAFWMVTREGYERAKLWQQNWSQKVHPDDPWVYGRDWYVDANNYKIGLRTYDPYHYMIKEWTPTQTHNLSVNGKSGNTDYNIGVGYLDQTGIIKPSKIDDFKRYNGSIRVGTDVNKWMRVYAGAMYSKRAKRYAYATSSTTADPWLYIYRWGPQYPMTTEDGYPLRGPKYEMEFANTASMETNYTSLNGGVTLSPVKDLKITLDYTHANQEYIELTPGTSFTAGDTWAAALAKFDGNGNRIYVNDAGVVVPSTTPGAMAAFRLNNWNYTSPGSNPDHIYRLSQNNQWNTINLKSSYDINIDNTHMMNFLVGVNKVDYQWANNWSHTTQLVDITNPQFNLAPGTQTTGGNANWESQLGVFGRVNYNYKDRYLVEANLRYDGTSKFPGDLKWRWFPSFSAGWRINEESWMEWSKPVVNALKVRASWGTIGDQSVSNSLYIPTMGGSQSSYIIGTSRLYQFGTPAAVSSDITWQDITTLNLGLDGRFFKSTLGVTFEWYRRDTENMLVPLEGMPTTYGTGAPQGNFGSLRTNGVEVQLDYNKRFKNGLGINIVATYADAITTITKYGSTQSIDSWYVGKRFGEIWGYQTDRLYQWSDFETDASGNLILITSSDGFQVNKLKDPNAATQGRLQSGNFRFGPGDVKFKDLNGDGVITPGNRLVLNPDGNPDYGDLEVIGNSTPRHEYSLRTGADYKGFDFSVFIQGIGKREIWGDGFQAIAGYNSSNGAMPQAMAGNFWREDRTDAYYPRPYNQNGSNNTLNMQVQSKYLLNMAYMRIKNITFGYSIPPKLLKKVDIKRLRVYAALENFFTLDHLGTLPIDAEEISGYSMWNTSNYNLGRTGTGVPTFKSASVGLQINF